MYDDHILMRINVLNWQGIPEADRRKILHEIAKGAIANAKLWAESRFLELSINAVVGSGHSEKTS